MNRLFASAVTANARRRFDACAAVLLVCAKTWTANPVSIRRKDDDDSAVPSGGRRPLSTEVNMTHSRIRRSSAFAIVGSVIVLIGLQSAPVRAQSTTTREGVMAPIGRAPFVTQQTPVIPTPEQLRMHEEGMRRSNPSGPPLPVEPGFQTFSGTTQAAGKSLSGGSVARRSSVAARPARRRALG